MLSSGIRTGKYKDPQIAEKVVAGSVYSRDNSLLSVQVPSYDLCFIKDNIKDMDAVCQTVSLYTNYSPSYLVNRFRSSKENEITLNFGLDTASVNSLIEDLKKTNEENSVHVVKNYVRNYPVTFHCSNLISQVERVYKDIIYPKPAFNEGITYGTDIQLTISVDVQYLLDVALQNLVNSTSSEFKALVCDFNTGEILAMSSTPFFTPDKVDSSDELAYFDTLILEDGSVIKPYFIKSPQTDNYREAGFTYPLEKPSDGSEFFARLPDKNNPKYVVYIWSEDKVDKSFYSNAVLTVYNGLLSQGRL